jgi:hypothetical protein
MDKILNMLSQQSTWKGIIGLSAAVGVTLSPELSTAIVGAAMGVIGLINVLRDEKKGK